MTLKKTIDQIRGTYGIYLNLVKKNRKITTRNQSDLETLGFSPIMPINLMDIGALFVFFFFYVTSIAHKSVTMQGIRTWGMDEAALPRALLRLEECS